MSDKKSSFFTGLLFGAVVGGAVYYLLGTEKGKKLQKEIKTKVKPYLDDLSELVENLPEEKEKLLEKMESLKDAVEEKIEDAKVIGEVPHIEKLQERGRKFFKNIKKPTQVN